MRLKKADKLEMSNGCLVVNGEAFVVSFPDEPLWEVDENQLVTVFRGHLFNYWKPEEIEGYLA